MHLHILLFIKHLCSCVTGCHLGFNVHSVPWGARQVPIPSITVIVWQGKAVVVMPVSGVHEKDKMYRTLTYTGKDRASHIH